LDPTSDLTPEQKAKLESMSMKGEYNRGQSTNLDRTKVGGASKRGRSSIFCAFLSELRHGSWINSGQRHSSLAQFRKITSDLKTVSGGIVATGFDSLLLRHGDGRRTIGTIGVSQQILTELRSVAVTAAMARAIRIEYGGAFYHVMARRGKQRGSRPNQKSES
jgi:hypothetical protein